MKETWRLINDPPLPGKNNMARDWEIFQEVASGISIPTLRLYRWNPPAISLGRFQKENEVVNLAVCRLLGIDVVRRPTGGRAVLHYCELTYSITVPATHRLVSGGILQSYQRLNQGILSAFQLLGINATLSPGRRRGGSIAGGSCFDISSAYEVQINGKKVVGSAQLRREGVVLQHGSILLELPLQLYGKVLNPVEKGEPLSRLGEKAAGLRDLGFEIYDQDLARAVIKAFSETFQLTFI